MGKARLFKDLLVHTMNQGGGLKAYKKNLRQALGIMEQTDGDPRLNADVSVLKNISLGEVAHTFLGKNFGPTDIKAAFGTKEAYQGRFEEAEGTIVLPSHFANISAFTDTVAGLVDALVLEAYQSPEFIGDKVCEVKERRMNGGYMIGVMNDGGLGEDLLDGEAAPTVGLKETKVHVPNNKRYANVIQVHEDVFTYDRTDQIQGMCTTSGYAVGRSREVRIADCFLGITNTYERDGNTANTYLTVAGDEPNSYVNSTTNQLIDWHDVDEAIQVLEGNTDPGTGFEISVPVDGADILVMPQRMRNAMNILKPEWIRRYTNTAADALQASNPLPNLNLIVANRIWYNRLIAASVSAANAAERWHLGRFKKAFGYSQIHPFSTTSLTLSSEDQRKDIVAVYYSREKGVPFTKEPRYSYQGTTSL